MGETMTLEEIQAEISAFQILLDDTDYKATKYSEGWYTEEEYEPIKQERQSWRDSINELEDLMEAMEQTKGQE